MAANVPASGKKPPNASGNTQNGVQAAVKRWVKAGGRQKGTQNKKTKLRIDIAIQILESGVTPLSIMWAMARGDVPFEENMFEAAKACAPYIHPKLMAVTLDGSVSVSHEQALNDLDDLERIVPAAGVGLAAVAHMEDDD